MPVFHLPKPVMAAPFLSLRNYEKKNRVCFLLYDIDTDMDIDWEWDWDWDWEWDWEAGQAETACACFCFSMLMHLLPPEQTAAALFAARPCVFRQERPVPSGSAGTLHTGRSARSPAYRPDG